MIATYGAECLLSHDYAAGIAVGGSVDCDVNLRIDWLTDW